MFVGSIEVREMLALCLVVPGQDGFIWSNLIRRELQKASAFILGFVAHVIPNVMQWLHLKKVFFCSCPLHKDIIFIDHAH